MLLELLLAASQILNLDQGQAYEVVARMECRTGVESIDMNGASSTSAIGGGEKAVTLIFMKKWPSETAKDVGVLVLETEGKTTTLAEATNGQNRVPILSDVPQAPISLGPAPLYSLTPEYGKKNASWTYEEVQILVHGAVRKYKGVCKLTEARAG